MKLMNILVILLLVIVISGCSGMVVGSKTKSISEQGLNSKTVSTTGCTSNAQCRTGYYCVNGKCITKTVVSSASGKSNDISIGYNLTQGYNKFDSALQDDDLAGLLDGTITFDGQGIDVSEELQLTPGTQIASALTSNDDLYGSNVYMELAHKKAIKFMYKFDETINLSKASESNPVNIKFIGQDIKIVNVASSGFYCYVNGIYRHYVNGDAFIGQNEDDPDWVWNLANLNVAGTTQVFGINNDNYFDDFQDNPLAVRSCLSLPNNYVKICLDSLTISDNTLEEYTFELETNTDLSEAIPSLTSVPTVHLSTTVNNGFIVGRVFQPTKEVWIYLNNSEAGSKTLHTFYRQSVSPYKIKYAGYARLNATVEDIVAFNYENTNSSNIALDASLIPNAVQFKLDINGDNGHNGGFMSERNIFMKWGYINDQFASLGLVKATEEASELISEMEIGTKNTDLRHYYGLIIKNPKVNGASDQVSLMIPPNQVFAKVTIFGPIN